MRRPLMVVARSAGSFLAPQVVARSRAVLVGDAGAVEGGDFAEHPRRALHQAERQRGTRAFAQTQVDSKDAAKAKSLIDEKYNKAATTDLSIEVKSGAAADAYDLKLAGSSGAAGRSGVPPMPK